MVFSSTIFIFRFLPIALFIYFLTPNKFKNLTLLILSLIFYSFGEPRYFIIMIFSIFIDFFIAKAIYKNQNKNKCIVLLTISILFNLGILFYFKYFSFFMDNINNIFNIKIPIVNLALPLGISFYTFQTMSYTIDVFNKKIKPEKNIINFGAFVSLFPQLISGPIVKYSDINNELKNRKINIDDIEKGIEEFIIGLGKKVLIANNVGLLWSEVQSIGFTNISTPLAWIGILSFSLQIYFDFSGYSSMAIGLGRILGFNFPINFNYPYISRSVTEFWRRWHITLGSWFKEYVYIPLGGNRVGVFRGILNLLIIWVLTGFWHGANYNFILWGLYFFIFIVIEKYLIKFFLKKHIILSHIYCILVLLIGWSIFSITNLNDLAIFLKKLFIYSNGLEWIYYLRNYIVILFLGIILSTPLLRKVYLNTNNYIKSTIMILIFIISIGYLVDASYNPFLYFRF
ncbi:MBOAT family protein [Clostridium carnis]